MIFKTKSPKTKVLGRITAVPPKFAKAHFTIFLTVHHTGGVYLAEPFFPRSEATSVAPTKDSHQPSSLCVPSRNLLLFVVALILK